MRVTTRGRRGRPAPGRRECRHRRSRRRTGIPRAWNRPAGSPRGPWRVYEGGRRRCSHGGTAFCWSLSSRKVHN